MGIPVLQQLAIATQLLGKKLAGEQRYPLVLMLEPLLQCNLACAGCGKVDHPAEVLARRLSVEDCLRAADECGAPVVSIAGGEPLVHEDIGAIVGGLVERRRFVYLCTNGLLLERKLGLFAPSDYLSLSVHLDGPREAHDASVRRPGVFDAAVAAIRRARSRGFRVTVNCTLFDDAVAGEVADFFDLVTGLGVDGITVSPGYRYELAPRQDVFLGRHRSQRLFRAVMRRGRGKKWPLSHSSLFLDFLCGNRSYRCTPWSTPTRNVLGWQKPCYLMADGHAATFAELMSTTDWDRYGAGRHPGCDDCMAHSGYEGTAVEDSFRHPARAALVSLRGPRLGGPMVPDPPLLGSRALPVVTEGVASEPRERTPEEPWLAATRPGEQAR